MRHSDEESKPTTSSRDTSTSDAATRTFLTLGDGDFSWSADLAAFLATAATKQTSVPSRCCLATTSTCTTGANRLVATGIDALADLRKKYTDFDSIVKKILRMNSASFLVEVKHEINAVDRSHSSMQPGAQDDNDEDSFTKEADVVIFHHPHLGTENAALHGRFLNHLFDAVNNKWMKEQGIFIVTLAAGQYERWRCDEAAKMHKFRLLDKRRFVPNAFADSVYELRRHQTGKSFRTRAGGSFSFIYARIDDDCSSIEKVTDLPWFQAADDGAKQTSESSNIPPDHRIDFACPYCDRIFREERSVKNHIASKHGGSNKKRKLQCTLCTEPRIFDCDEALRDHQQAKHQGMHGTIQPDWVSNVMEESSSTLLGRCSICGIHFTSTFGHNEHMATFLPLPPQTFPCQFCSKTFGSQRAKKQHENFCSASHSLDKTSR